LAALRALFAMIMALSLTLAPLTPALAMKPMPASATMAAGEAKKPHCHEAKHQKTPDKACCCCDHTKSKCPDGGCACLLKCGAQTLAIFAADEPIRSGRLADFHSMNPAKPPGLQLTPAGPPPRV
jgi:hypothetical protein